MQKDYWVVTDSHDEITEISANRMTGRVSVVSGDGGAGIEILMSYTAEQLDDYIAALTEARRAIS